MSYSALWLPDAIRDMGVEPVEVDGWQNRGHGDVDPLVFVSHHTADGPNGAVNSLGVVVNGASYTASGPLANILQSREPGEGNDRAFIVAAGTSYNAGTGGWNGASGNVHTIGNEIEHTGTAPLPRHRMETACKIAAGCLLAMGQPAENHCHHWEWSWPPGSKIDVCCQDDGQKCSGDEWRALTDQYMHGGPAPGPAPPDLGPVAATVLNQRGNRMFAWTSENAGPTLPWFESGMLYEFTDYAVTPCPGVAYTDVLGSVKVNAETMYGLIAARWRAAKALNIPLS